ncbi:hypothetical protein HY386_00195 [Candidatus Daviesbacteria bacterium]|nr:hypothetical protein [Candidatus Daviesbacteria bacterium]
MIEQSSTTVSELKQVRVLFPQGRLGSQLYRQALQKETPKQILEMREHFGEGNSGSRSFIIVTVGSQCEAKDEKGNQCQNPATMTIDFDILSSEENIPVCGRLHELQVRRIAAQDLGKDPYDPTFGINGRGRA